VLPFTHLPPAHSSLKHSLFSEHAAPSARLDTQIMASAPASLPEQNPIAPQITGPHCSPDSKQGPSWLELLEHPRPMPIEIEQARVANKASKPVRRREEGMMLGRVARNGPACLCAIYLSEVERTHDRAILRCSTART